jgi:hypothetical protein
VTPGGLKGGDDLRPNVLFGPSVKSRVGCVPFSVFSRKITPWRPGPRDPEDGFKESPVIAARTARISLFAGEYRRNCLPERIGEVRCGQRTLPARRPGVLVQGALAFPCGCRSLCRLRLYVLYPELRPDATHFPENCPFLGRPPYKPAIAEKQEGPEDWGRRDNRQTACGLMHTVAKARNPEYIDGHASGSWLGCSSSVVEHSLGKGEVESSILSCSTILFKDLLVYN